MADELDRGTALAKLKTLETCVESVVRQPGGGGEDVFVHDRV
jgi:hypothetical protein